ncbi:MAG: hypothetical protein LBQ54_00185 [Planctomycetaceae bacterium]|jgi:hypothetical protein|nr:hypothetical protein [Planctomycetaceae bacterium]
MNRRNLVKCAALGTIGIFSLAGLKTVAAAEGKKPPKYPNEHFYKSGNFDFDTGKAAYAELFKYHHYSLGDTVLKSPEFWILEFAQNDFSNVGMGGIFFINDKEHGYFGHEIYLLPGQMIAEHYHVAAEDKPAKHESWQVRHGSIWTVAKGGDKSKAIFPIPKSQEKYLTCFNAKFHEVGDIERLSDLEEPHFMMAGPEGAIVTEYASYHSGLGLKFTNPTVKV